MSRVGTFCRAFAAAGLAFLSIGDPAQGADYSEVQLLASNRAGDQFGAAVAVGANVIAVGAYLSDEGGRDSGAVYLFHKVGNEWKVFEGSPLHRDNTPGEWFGFDVAIDQEGKFLVVGAPSPGNGGGKAFRYDLEYDSAKGRVVNERQLSAPTAKGDEFGSAVAIDGSLIAVGARGANRRAGQAYVFSQSGGPQPIAPPDPVPGREFGQSIALSGTTLVVGEPLPGENGKSSGAAYAFVQGDGKWALQGYPRFPSGLGAGSAFGYGVGVQGEKIMAGAPLANHSVGAVYRLVGGAWEALKVDARPGDQFGVAIGMSSNEAVIGARGARNRAGAAYLYTWGGKQEPLDHASKANSEFGFGATIRGNVIVVGAFKESAAYVFEKKLPPAQDVTLQFEQGGHKVESIEVPEGRRIPVKLALETTDGEALKSDLTVTLITRNGTPEGQDYSFVKSSIIFKQGKVKQAMPVEVEALSDCLDEEDETFTLSVEGVKEGTAPELGVKILDANVLANLVLTPTPPTPPTPPTLATREPSFPATFKISLACEPRSPVQVRLESSDETRGTVSDIPLWFTAKNWNEPQEVEVQGQDNADCSKFLDYSVNIETSSEDPLFDRLETSVPLRHLNDDICLTATQSVCVDGGTILYTVTVENTGNVPYSAGDRTIVELPEEEVVGVAASADHGTATMDYVENEVVWGGFLPVGTKARIDILAQLEAVPPGTEISNSATLPYDVDGDGIIDSTVETNEAVFQAGDVIPCPPGP